MTKKTEEKPAILYQDMDMLRFTTAGSVDDGKSTLIGRLLYDSKSIFEDQMDAITRSSQSSGEDEVNLALLTDGLRAEREQKITIDVAYRYFATPKRKFIISDTPGHIQYTRNMVTGASTAELAIVLIDATRGVLTQSKRHAFISSLLKIPHLVIAVNKMDLVGFSEQRFDEIVNEFREFSKKLDVSDITYIPVSALKGDNVVDKSDNLDWYNGSTLLHHLETVKVDTTSNVIDFRFPVQYVIRPNQNFRGFAGKIASGRIKPGDEITVLPSGLSSRVKRIVTMDGDLDEALSGDCVTLTIEDEIDISRGDMIVRKNNVPKITNRFDAYLCWMDQQPMKTGKQYLLMHTTRITTVYFDKVMYRMNVDTLSREDATELGLNEIGRVKITTAGNLFVDAYQLNQKTGSFIVIDPDTNLTVGAGMIRSDSTESRPESEQKSPDVTWEPWNITREERENRNRHKAAIIWLTGISGAGKSTISKELEKQLWAAGKNTILLDGDQLRHGLNRDLGFSPADRTENIRRVGEVARLFFEHGNIVLCTFVSPYREDREIVKSLVPEGRFIEVFVTCSPETAMNRDPKGLYKKAVKGEITGLTGYDADHEGGSDEALILDTDKLTVEMSVREILNRISSLT